MGLTMRTVVRGGFGPAVAQGEPHQQGWRCSKVAAGTMVKRDSDVHIPLGGGGRADIEGTRKRHRNEGRGPQSKRSS